MLSEPWGVAAIERLVSDDQIVAAARELLKLNALRNVQARADGRGWWAKVRGPTGHYEVTVGDQLSATFNSKCTCPSWGSMWCEHAIGLLLYLAENPDRRLRPEAGSALGGDFESLLSGVFARPADDAARLVFADYVEERGDADRAKLIRRQVERSHRREKVSDAEVALPGEEEAIVGPLLADLPARLTARAVRGFLQLTIECQTGSEADDWPDSAARLFRAGWVESLIFSVGVPNLTEALRRLCAQVGSVVLSSQTPSDAVLHQFAVLLPPGRLPGRLKRVVVPQLSEPSWERLAAKPESLPERDPQFEGVSATFEDVPLELFRHRVARGELSGAVNVCFVGPLNPGVAAEFATSPQPERCRALTFAGCNLEAADGVALAASPHLARVEHLCLGGTTWGAGAAAAWLDSALVGRLKRLNLQPADPICDADLAALECRQTPDLRELELGEGDYSVAAVESFLRSRGPLQLSTPVAPSLRSSLASLVRPPGGLLWCLSLWSSRLTPREALALRLRLADGPRELRSGSGFATFSVLGTGRHLTLLGRLDDWPVDAHTLDWSGVVGLTVQFVEIDAGWFSSLPRCFPGGLTHLGVQYAQLDARHGPPLVSALEALKPRTLNLANNQIDATTVKLIVDSPAAARLQTLDLRNNHLQSDALDAILASPHLRKLRHLDLGSQQEKYDAAARDRFEKIKPKTLAVSWGWG